MEVRSNALRFISAYNQIEQALKQQNNLRSSMSYTEAVRLSARNNSIVRKYEDQLVDYGRLRNAIVHSADDTAVIAEPNDIVVEEYEKIAKLITSPPLATDTVCVKNVKCTSFEVPLKHVMMEMYTSGFSNFPVYNNGMLVGVANAGKITRFLGKKLYNKNKVNDLMELPIGDVVKDTAQDGFYALADSKITLDKVLNMFSENRKLLLVIITENGTLIEKPLGIITVADILDINKIINNFE